MTPTSLSFLQSYQGRQLGEGRPTRKLQGFSLGNAESWMEATGGRWGEGSVYQQGGVLALLFQTVGLYDVTITLDDRDL